MKRVATAVVLIPLVVLLVLRAPQWVLASIAGLVALLAIREYMGLVTRYGFRPFPWPIYLATLLIFWNVAHAFTDVLSVGYISREPFVALAVIVVLAAYASLVLALRGNDLRSAVQGAAMSFLAIPYITLPLALLVDMRMGIHPGYRVVIVLVVVWAGDIAAYFVGRSLGRRKLAPRISPNKTWEGAVASALGAVAVGLLLLRYENYVAWFLGRFGIEPWYMQPPAWHGLALAALALLAINVAAQLGDLVESALKRGAGVKDSGTLLPGHGGMLDRIDALLFAAPVAWLLFAFLWT